MTRDDIIRMAQEAGGRMYSSDEVDFFLHDLEKFAALVYERVWKDAGIAATRTVIDAAVLIEREACAKACEDRYMGDNNREDMEARRCAAAIRARSNT